MQFLVVDRQDESIHVLDMKDVVALKKKGKTLEFHTKTHIYEQITSLDSLTPFLRQYGFERLDRDNIVNMSRISRFESGTNKVVIENADKAPKFFTVSWANVQKVLDVLKRRNKPKD